MAEKVTKVFKPKEIINEKEAQALEDLLEWQKEFQEEVKEELSEIEKLRFKDIDWRLKNRENFRKFLMFLLVAQNITVFALVLFALQTDKIQSLQLVFTTLISGTLLETTALILIIVKSNSNVVQFVLRWQNIKDKNS